MDTFSMILLICAVLFVVVYYYNQYSNWSTIQSTLTWPREYNQCPDYWISKGNGLCQNTKNIGKCPLDSKGVLVPNGTVDFKPIVGGVSANPLNEEVFNQEMNTPANLVKKCKWTKQCGSTWEGVDHLCV